MLVGRNVSTRSISSIEIKLPSAGNLVATLPGSFVFQAKLLDCLFEGTPYFGVHSNEL